MIIHVDMDAFYAAVEIRDRPELQGQPVVVGGSPTGRGVVSAASYEARRFGIHSAMPARRVLQLCPRAVFIRPRMDHYAAVSRQIRSIFNSYTSLVEPLSLDEAFLDVSGSERLFGSAISIARQIKQRIRAELGLVASAGVAPNKYLAKVASDLEKPDGLVFVPADGILEFLDRLPISRIWGVGKICEARFAAMGIRTIGQLRRLSLAELEPQFGIHAQHFWNLARGIDDRVVVPDRQAKSISHESTFATDLSEPEVLEAWGAELAGQVARRLRRQRILGKTVQLKLRFSDFRTVTRAVTLPEPTDITREISETAVVLIRRVLAESRQPVRLLGIGVTNLRRDGDVQRLLFAEEEQEKERRLDAATDEIVERFGRGAVTSGRALEKDPPPKTLAPHPGHDQANRPRNRPE